MIIYSQSYIYFITFAIFYVRSQKFAHTQEEGVTQGIDIKRQKTCKHLQSMSTTDIKAMPPSSWQLGSLPAFAGRWNNLEHIRIILAVKIW